MKKISELENEFKNEESFLNNDNLCGTINIPNENILEFKMGVIPNSSFEIHIEGGEGFIPHFHLCKKSGKNIILRIEILNNKYFREKDDKMNILNSSERKALNEYLTSEIGGNSGNHWQYLVRTWNLFNPAHTIDLTLATQPDYSEILEP